MTYKETIEYLFNSTPVFEHVGASAYKPGLQTTEILDAHYGHPHKNFKTIHIAGTNGKGSVSHSLASILQEAGYKVGLYTSPHLIDFRERIRVNGIPVSEEYVIRFVEDFKHLNSKRIHPLSPSFFELTTALAFKYFAEEKIDIAVIEVGLGGRLDCTNIITPILSVITNISFDHTQFLGNTLAQIASEKAGIIKHQVPVVIGETTKETRPVFENKAKEMDAPIFFAEDIDKSECDQYEFELKGSYQKKNLRTILCATKRLPFIHPEHIQKGLTNVCKNTGLMGRWQTLSTNPLIICDTGHNVGGWKYLAPQISSVPCDRLHIVFGMVDDKDIRNVLSMLPKNAVYYFTQANNHRAIPAQQVGELAKEYGLSGNTYPTVAQAYEEAKSSASENDFIFIGGSSYIVADLLCHISK
jgi:dihydrofolate synthase/folylpolyglutamate synthase